ncbi:unnamed protein product [Protopolystoma xenopodis]|uniref:Uncharacterized protein n=1 Tax=Protopolystoma xenopodis TaxID=117903 RepID=A0A3S5C855_9PLAT|nr:unnamed protein product [Protopolystoma xenopodis]
MRPLDHVPGWCRLVGQMCCLARQRRQACAQGINMAASDFQPPFGSASSASAYSKADESGANSAQNNENLKHNNPSGQSIPFSLPISVALTKLTPEGINRSADELDSEAFASIKEGPVYQRASIDMNDMMRVLSEDKCNNDAGMQLYYSEGLARIARVCIGFIHFSHH